MHPATLLLLTPTLGRSPYLDETIASVDGLGLPTRHLLVCPADRVEELSARFPGKTVVPDAGPAGGLYGALNAGLAAAEALDWQWFTYLNDDDALVPGFAELFRRHVRGPDGAASVAYGDILNVDPAGRSLGRMTIERNPRWLPALLRQGISPLGQQGMLFGRPVVARLGGFSTAYRLCADLDFWARALAAGFPFRTYPWTVGRFRLQPGQLSGDVELTRRELADISARHLPGPTPTGLARAWGRLRYRLRNAPRYLERRRALGGWVGSEAVLAAGGRHPAAGEGAA